MSHALSYILKTCSSTKTMTSWVAQINCGERHETQFRKALSLLYRQRNGYEILFSQTCVDAILPQRSLFTLKCSTVIDLSVFSVFYPIFIVYAITDKHFNSAEFALDSIWGTQSHFFGKIWQSVHPVLKVEQAACTFFTRHYRCSVKLAGTEVL